MAINIFAQLRKLNLEVVYGPPEDEPSLITQLENIRNARLDAQLDENTDTISFPVDEVQFNPYAVHLNGEESTND